MTIEIFRELLDHYLMGTLSEEERKEFSQALKQPEFASELEIILQETFMKDTYEGVVNPLRRKRLRQLLRQKIEAFPVKIQGKKRQLKIFSIKRLAAASIILIAIAGAFYFASLKPHTKTVAVKKDKTEDKVNEILPGHQGATLQLSDGTVIVLDSVKNGTLAMQGNIQVVKENGQIFYKGKNGAILYNNISTAKGRQWSVVLPDGSKVWLNAESSIHYPLSFTGKERVVDITGEAYFEVAHNAKMPFKVKAGGSEIQVLGTHFNINSYKDEPAMRSTLIEGSISITNGISKKIIQPGQQASILNNTSEINVAAADVQNAIAWKNGYFSFHNADLKMVMRQLARWYDIEIVYGNQVPRFEFEGDIDMSLKLSAVLRILEKTGVNFKIEKNNKLIILP